MHSSALRRLISNKVLQEMTPNWIQDVSDFVYDRMHSSFSNIFGNKMRIAIPFDSIALKRIKGTIEETDPSIQVDIDSGTVTKTIQTQKGSKQRTERLGRVLQKNSQNAAKIFVEILREHEIFANIDGTVNFSSTDKTTKEFLDTLATDTKPPLDSKSKDGLFRLASVISEKDQYGQGAGATSHYLKIVAKKWLNNIMSSYYDNITDDEYNHLLSIDLEPVRQRMEDPLWRKRQDSIVAGSKKVDKIVAAATTYYQMQKMQNDYVEEAGGSSIIISRHPIDVLRMSDFKNIQSCHSQGGSYFRCAVEEAKRGGLIAYLVKNEDLKQVNLEEDEIFEDKERNKAGIKPMARLRLRQFRADNGFNLAVPEVRVYGNNREGFLETVTKWANETQRDDMIEYGIDPENFDMKSFKLMGGSYYDNEASKLFNNMFDTTRFYGNVNYGGEEESIDNQVEQEAQDYYDNYTFNELEISWHIIDDGNVYWEWDYSNTFSWATPGPINVRKAEEWKIDGKLERKINRSFTGIRPSTIQVTIDTEFIYVEIEHLESGFGHPDDFNDALDSAELFEFDLESIEDLIGEFMYDYLDEDNPETSLLLNDDDEEDDDDEEEDDEEEDEKNRPS